MRQTEHERIFSESARLTEDERKILLYALKVLFYEKRMSRHWGYPVDLNAIKNLVTKLGGEPDLL